MDTEAFQPVGADAVDRVRRRFAVDGPFLLSLGGIEPRKNLPALIRAYASLPDGLRPALVIAGPVAPWNPEGWNLVRPALEALPPGVRDRVVVTGYVSEQEKVALLGGAEALVYPSLYEGFGLPVIEAMACGTPVLTSNVSALPETAGDAALLVDPHSVEGIAAGIERLLTDSALRERLRSAGLARVGAFSWEETARRTAEVLRRGRLAATSRRVDPRTRWIARRSSSSERTTSSSGPICSTSPPTSVTIAGVPSNRARASAGGPSAGVRKEEPVGGAHPGVEVFVAREPLEERHSLGALGEPPQLVRVRHVRRDGVPDRPDDHETPGALGCGERSHRAIEALPRMEESGAQEERFGGIEAEVSPGRSSIADTFDADAVPVIHDPGVDLHAVVALERPMLRVRVEQESSARERLAQEHVVRTPPGGSVGLVYEDLRLAVAADEGAQPERRADLRESGGGSRPVEQPRLEVDDDAIERRPAAGCFAELPPAGEGDTDVAVAIGRRDHGDGVAVGSEPEGLRMRVGPDPAVPWRVGRNDGDPHRASSLAAASDGSVLGRGGRGYPMRSSSTRSGNTTVARIILGNRRGSNANRQAHSSPSLRSAAGARSSSAHTSSEPPTPMRIRADGTASALRAIHRSCFGAPNPTRTIAGEPAAIAPVGRIVLGGVDHPVLGDRDACARDRDPESGKRPYPALGRAPSDAVAPADEGHRGVALRGDPHQELADLYPGHRRMRRPAGGSRSSRRPFRRGGRDRRSAGPRRTSGRPARAGGSRGSA